jgi:hypothetical protein
MTTGGMTVQEQAKLVHRFIGVSGGYLGNFTYATHESFYPVYCDLDIKPAEHGDTTKRRFEAILAGSSPADQAKIIRGTLEYFPVDGPAAPSTRTADLRDELLAIAKRLEGANVTVAIRGQTRESVLRAIQDAEDFIKTADDRAVNALDRAHTALHGYLLSTCDAAGITYGADPTMTALLKLLRAQHPKLTATGARAEDVTRVLHACGTILDALNPLRNRASVAHPNSDLLPRAESLLVVNVSRSLLAFLDDKVTS